MSEHGEQPEVSRHKCLIYEGHPSEQLPVVVPLLMAGLQENWRCLYLGSPDAVQMVDQALLAKGVDTMTEAKRGALVLSSERSHLTDGRFDPDGMIGEFSSTIDGAVRDGFRGLCATGDMRWELGEDENFGHLLRYEALLEQLFREKPLRGICQYHREVIPAEAVRDALVTHRAAYVGAEFNRDNPFYLPPELLLQSRNGAGASRHSEWMCQQILRVTHEEQARDEVLRDLEKQVAEHRAELAVTNSYLRAFSYSVSHDLRAPLRAIHGFGAALAEDSGDKLDAQGRKHLDRILSNARAMEGMIEGMLVLGRAVETQLQRTPIDLTALVREVAHELVGAHPERVVDLTIHPGLRVVGDRILLRAAVTNLLANAWKFTAQRPDARIEFGRKEEGGASALFVRDNGVGFDMKYATKLFGLFQRLHSGRDFPGTGVGLATVERIVSRHGGRIWAEGNPGEGATFFFTLAAETLPDEISSARDRYPRGG